jgi:putative MATE family efflux protein
MKKHTVDMTKGSIFRHIIAFAIPIMISGILQTLYNAADMIVVGKFSGKQSLAAVGSTSSAINLMISIFVGMSSATNVIVARKFGAGNKSGVSKAVHTAIAVCLCGGTVLMILGILLSRKILVLMDSPNDVIELATLYMRIYFIGIPAMLLYNFGSATMRAVGDAKRPTYFLTASGIINVSLNLLFVIVFKMGVAGVAIATVTSQVVSALLVLRCLVKADDCYQLDFKKVRIYAHELKEIVFLGIPAGIQSALFSISNVIIQSSINSVGSDAMAGNSAAASVEGMVYIAMNAFFHATLTFVGQNYGAHNFKRIRKGFLVSMAISFVVGSVLSTVVSRCAGFLVGFYTNIPEVRDIGVMRMQIVCALYFLCGMMEVATGAIRGMGVAIRSMITCVVGVCFVRIVAVMMGAPYKEVPDIKILYYSFPVSWAITTTILTILFFTIVRCREKEWLAKEKAV